MGGLFVPAWFWRIAALGAAVALFGSAAHADAIAGKPSPSTATAAIEVELRLARLPGAAALRRSERGAERSTPALVRAFHWPEGVSDAQAPSEVVDADAASVPGSVVLRVRPGRWIVVLEAASLWSAPVLVQAEAGQRQAVELEVFETGVLEGQWEVPRGVTLPVQLEATFEPARAAAPPVGGDPGVGGIVPCSLDESIWSCRLPKGSLDVRLSAPGFSDTFLWGVAIGDAARRLPPVTLVEGSSVFGWAVGHDSSTVAGAGVELSPLDAAVAVPERAQLHARTVLSDSRGFFHFAGMPPGAYRVSASYAEARSEARTVVVTTGESKILDEPLVLFAPIALEIYVDPPLAPDGKAWLVDARPLWERSLAAAVEDVPVAETGAASLSGLAPGSYGIVVKDSNGSRWWATKAEVAQGTPPLFASIEAVAVEGIVHLGDVPLEAELTFTRREQGFTLLVSDPGGRFQGALPGAGAYDLEVHAERRRVRHLAPGLEVEADDAFLDIEIPDTRIAGQVVDGEGHLQRTAIVNITASGELIQELLDDGRFDVRGLAAGPVTVSAQARGEGGPRSSAPVELDLEHQAQVIDLRLVLREKRKITGRVVGPTGVGVPGATVTFSWEGRAGSPLLVTDGEGRFEDWLEGFSEALTVTLVAPGFACRALALPAAETADLTLTLSSEAGVLIFRAPVEPPTAQLGSQVSYLLHAGAVVDPYFLRSCAMASGGSEGEDGLRALVEPGAYEACLAPASEVWSLSRGMRSPDWRCTSGYLAPGGELTLSLLE